MPDLDPAAVEAGNGCGAVHEQAKAVCTRPAGHDGSHRPEYFRVLTENAGLKAGLAEARASLERITERLEQTVRLASRWHDRAEAAERDVDRLMRRAIQAEADLAVCREALENHIRGVVAWLNSWDPGANQDLIDAAEEALSRLAHSSEEER